MMSMRGALLAGVRQTFTAAAARSASRVHPLPPIGGTPPRATAMSHDAPPGDGSSTFKSRRGPLIADPGEGALAGHQGAS